ncbi:regulatory protein, tetR [Streptomyces laurentii]|uniref:Regulatory protein, tetR n=1 Tax=Streptomyces laurentii TaxID=39478 RepID=A0A160P8D4_STRLU|nr:regulatory protein, tetR [Streptomyces laurentii]
MRKGPDAKASGPFLMHGKTSRALQAPSARSTSSLSPLHARPGLSYSPPRPSARAGPGQPGAIRLRCSQDRYRSSRARPAPAAEYREKLARPLEEAKKARLRSAQRAGQLDPGADLDWSSTCSTRPSSRGGCTAALR